MVLWPFFPSNLLDVRLNEVFIAVEEYIEELEPRKIQVFERTIDILETYLFEAEQYGTKYSREYLGGFVKKLVTLLQEDFEQCLMPNLRN